MGNLFKETTDFKLRLQLKANCPASANKQLACREAELVCRRQITKSPENTLDAGLFNVVLSAIVLNVIGRFSAFCY